MSWGYCKTICINMLLNWQQKKYDNMFQDCLKKSEKISIPIILSY